MNTVAQMQQDAGAELLLEPSSIAAGIGAPASAAASARSEKNILQWMSYLPEDCIRTMIEMGWDVTT